MSLDVEGLRDSFQLAIRRSPALVDRFLAILSSRYPQIQPILSGGSATHDESATRAFAAVLDHLTDAPWLETRLTALGAQLASHALTEDAFDWAGDCWMKLLAEATGEAWSPRIQLAWLGLCVVVARCMGAGGRLEEPGVPSTERSLDLRF